ncbi:MAG: hypothetical protein ACXVH1_30525 [Solirubrobacteraceae bacterium]|jgi:hypothetical protein
MGRLHGIQTTHDSAQSTRAPRVPSREVLFRFAQNAIEVGSGSSASATDNTVSGNAYSGTNNAWSP